MSWTRTGSGARMKLINNLMTGVEAAALAEAVALIEHSGLDQTKTFDALNNSVPAGHGEKDFSAIVEQFRHD